MTISIIDDDQTVREATGDLVQSLGYEVLTLCRSVIRQEVSARRPDSRNRSENRLPAKSEIRFRPPGMWDQYHLQILAA
jgi:hypothetical protein